MDNFLKIMLEYQSLGYEITLTNVYGKDAIRMTKIYSHLSETPLDCLQVINLDILQDDIKLHDLTNFMYQEIRDKEESITKT